MQRKIAEKVDVLIVLRNGAIEHVSTSIPNNVSVIEVFDATPVPLLAQSVSNVMTKKDMRATAQGALDLYYLHERKKETENGEENQQEENSEEDRKESAEDTSGTQEHGPG